jgi:hypothetical protein
MDAIQEEVATVDRSAIEPDSPWTVAAIARVLRDDADRLERAERRLGAACDLPR